MRLEKIIYLDGSISIGDLQEAITKYRIPSDAIVEWSYDYGELKIELIE
ncbi:hypothetical protein ABZ470_31860 [Streptosporangium sp. NPDC020072]